MIIYFGTRLYGKTDVVPGTCHVATRFFHLYRIPFIPLGSWIITGQTLSTFQGIQTRLSIKSVLLAWMRAACVVSSLACSIAAITELCKKTGGHKELIIPCAVAAIVGLVLWRASYLFSTASPHRTRDLLVKLGLPADAAEDFAFTSQPPVTANSGC
jgi:hypothetical protein